MKDTDSVVREIVEISRKFLAKNDGYKIKIGDSFFFFWLKKSRKNGNNVEKVSDDFFKKL